MHRTGLNYLLFFYRHDYQRRAVTWMFEREQSIQQNLTFPHPLFFPVELEYGKSVYINYSTGQTAQHWPCLRYPVGGILAEEMGLGKTLETLSLMLTNPKPNLEPHLPADLTFANVKHSSAQFLTCHCTNRGGSMATVYCVKCGKIQHARCWETEQVCKGRSQF